MCGPHRQGVSVSRARGVPRTWPAPLLGRRTSKEKPASLGGLSSEFPGLESLQPPGDLVGREPVPDDHIAEIPLSVSGAFCLHRRPTTPQFLCSGAQALGTQSIPALTSTLAVFLCFL